MTTAGDERDPCKGDRAGEKFRKRPFRQYSNGVSEHSAQGGGSYASISATIGMSELEQILKHKTFTRSEIQLLIAVLNSRITDESPSDILIVERDGAKIPPHSSPPPAIRLEASPTSGSLKRHKHADESDNLHASIVSSGVVEEQIASPSELSNAYKGSTIVTAKAPRQNLKLFDNNASCFSKISVGSPQHPATIENLPHEVLSNISIRLFSKQLAQMRSVSKSWNELLSQSSFIKSHLHHSIHNKSQILLVFHYKGEPSSDFKPLAAFPCRSPHRELTSLIKLPDNPQPEFTYDIEVIGSVNGLICSCYGDSVIQIWNPSLSAVLTLPPYSMPSGGYHRIETLYRFGFDPKTEDYKVVKLTGLTGPATYAIEWWLQVEIFSMRKGSWELINGRFPSHVTEVCFDGHDGRLHWLCCINGEAHTQNIVAFDLGSEKFHEMPLPHSTIDDNRDNIIGILAGKLCVMSCMYDDACEVWVMEEYGVADSWVKRHVFPQFIGDTYPFGFTSDNEFLIRDNGYLVLYNQSANERKILEDLEEDGVAKIVEYVDSLVWVAPAEHEMVDG